MARTRTPQRLADIVSVATEVFIASGGIHRAQMHDVAKAAGIAKGTLYLYVESKEALFDLAVRHADGPQVPDQADLPIRTPAPGTTLAHLRERLRTKGHFERLEAVLEDGTTPSAQQLREVLEELYGVLEANRVAISLVNASARDAPELAEFWFDAARKNVHQRLARYIGQGIRSGVFTAQHDVDVAARLVLETTMWFAVQRHRDPRPDPQSEQAVRRTIIDNLLRALLA
jgi:AcrR family transcriptional regulator